MAIKPFAVFCFVASGFFLVAIDDVQGTHGISFSPPENCPHEDPETHVCSRLHSDSYFVWYIGCCGDRDDASDESDDDEGRRMCHSWCANFRRVTVYKCITECCEGFTRSWNGTCHNRTSEEVCQNGGTLHRRWGMHWYCDCPSGYVGRRCQRPLCFCENGGTCMADDHVTPFCYCPDGYHGEHCEFRKCTLKCQNGGTCVAGESTEMCNCQLPYVGRLCENTHTDSEKCPAPLADAVDGDEECETRCTSDAQCTRDMVCCREGCSLVCKIPRATTCQQDGRTFAIGETYSPDPCTNCTCVEPGSMACSNVIRCPNFQCQDGSHPVKKPGQCCPSCLVPCYCNNGGTCVQQAGKQVCKCPEGYNGNYCEHRICSLQCENGGSCDWEDGAEVCRCTLPFVGRLCEQTHTDSPMCPETSAESDQPTECETECQMDAQCTGNLLCCSRGCSLRCMPPRVITCEKDRRTFNVGDEYSPNPCEACTCMETGDMICAVHSCAPTSCPPGSQPVSQPGQCCMGCSVPCTCENGGSCSLEAGKPVCTCPQRYEGKRCETLKPVTCTKDGRIFKVGDQYTPDPCNTCVCTESSEMVCAISDCAHPSCPEGSQLIRKPGQCCSQCSEPCICENSGSCRLENGEPVCTCPQGYTGDRCEHRTCNLQCQNGGTCMMEVEGDLCRCPLPFVGPLCESRHINSDMCPEIVEDTEDPTECEMDCHVDDQCTGNLLCCRSGCSLRCTPPRVIKCEKDGHTFNVGDKYSPNPCETCTCSDSGIMECAVYDCLPLDCPEGSNPISVQGQCCQVCSDPPPPPPRIACPVLPVVVDLGPSSKSVYLGEVYTGVRAYDGDGKLLQVAYEPDVVSHCACAAAKDHVETVVAKARDNQGNVVTCKIQVKVRDLHPPKISYCPKHITAVEDTQMSWPKPDFRDNVGILGNSSSPSENGGKFPAGVFTVQYNAWDYDMNRAVCRFTVNITKKAPPPEPKPPTITCPQLPVSVEVVSKGKVAWLTKENTKVTALDSNRMPLSVQFDPSHVTHCGCTFGDYQTVVAFAMDDNGGRSQCSFQVEIKDSYPPTVLSCPEDVYIFTGEKPEWKEPKFWDNVGVKNFNRRQIPETLDTSTGNYSIEYTAWDYDLNQAKCQFDVFVVGRGTSFDELPLGMKERVTASDEENSVKLGLYIGVAVGGLVFLAILALLLCCLKRFWSAKFSAKSQPPGTSPNFDNHIYHLPDDVKRKPSTHSVSSKAPSYVSAKPKSSSGKSARSKGGSVRSTRSKAPSIITTHSLASSVNSMRSNPPPYSSTWDLREVQYYYQEPPTYTESVDPVGQGYVNPAYQTNWKGRPMRDIRF